MTEKRHRGEPAANGRQMHFAALHHFAREQALEVMKYLKEHGVSEATRSAVGREIITNRIEPIDSYKQHYHRRYRNEWYFEYIETRCLPDNCRAQSYLLKNGLSVDCHFRWHRAWEEAMGNPFVETKKLIKKHTKPEDSVGEHTSTKRRVVADPRVYV